MFDISEEEQKKILNDLNSLTEKEINSEEGKRLNQYFFNDENFVKQFLKNVGGSTQHHNYVGGLVEHTYSVTYIAKILAYKYDCRFKEIAILSAKLHDIGKLIEYSSENPLEVTFRGEMEGHVLIGLSMLERAFETEGNFYSEQFKNRIRGCVAQHHGKPEFGSAKAPNSEESYIVHFADYIDATFNKIGKVKRVTPEDSWSEYDKALGTKLFF